MQKTPYHIILYCIPLRHRRDEIIMIVCGVLSALRKCRSVSTVGRTTVSESVHGGAGGSAIKYKIKYVAVAVS